MARKPGPKWSVDDVISVFNSLPPGQRRMSKRELMRITSGWRDRAHFNWLVAQLICPLPGMKHKFVAQVDPQDRRKVWIEMVDRGY